MPIDVKSAATTATQIANKLTDTASVASGLKAATSGIDALKNSVSSGVNSVVDKLSNAVPGQIKGILDLVPKVPDLNFEDIIKGQKSVVSFSSDPPFPNVLHNYASFNYIWTLSVLSPQDLNFPDESYRKGKLGPIILKSGSGSPDDRVETIYKSSANPSGKYDYMIDDVKISGSIGMDKTTGNTNATGLSFSIIEPYSMGLFFQSLQIAALEAGYLNYVDCPLLLRLEFTGHVDQYKQNISIPGTTKYFPIKIMDIKMRVTGQGSVYTCEAVPWNERAHNTTYSQVKTEVNIEGSTVQEMIQTGEKSLQKVVNDRYLESIKRKEVTVPDQIIILFPTDLKTSDAQGEPNEDSSNAQGATVNPTEKSQNNQNVLKRLGVVRGTDGFNLKQIDNINPIGLASLGFNEFRKGDPSFAKDNAVYDTKTGTYKRGNLTIKKNSSEARFAQGTDIPNIINQVILASDYGRQALDPDKITDDGFVNWWKIETQLYVMDTDANLDKTGRKPNLVVYRVIPHKVHHSKFLAPNQAAKGVEQIKLQAVKRYDYLYTSKNLDILDFAIEFNTAFYTALTADKGKNNINVQTQANSGGLAPSNVGPVNSQASSTDGVNRGANGQLSGVTSKLELGSVPTSTFADKVRTKNSNTGGPGGDNPATIAARQFHDAITESADMVELNMKILGDPFYLGDSGMGNYSAQASNLKGINGDGSINNQDSEVFINVRFRNPVDINRITGRYDFPGGDSVPQFSGLYRVSLVENDFSKGQFTQTLTLTRMVGQDIKDDEAEAKTLVSDVADKVDPNDPESYIYDF